MGMQPETVELSPAVRDQIERLVKGIHFNDENPCDDIEFEEETNTWWTSIDIETAEGLQATFEVEFQYLQLPESDQSDPYLILCWVVIPPDELRTEPGTELELFQAINSLNSEPGIKFRLHPEGEGKSSLVCEVDLPASLLTQQLVETAFVRSINMVAAYFGDLQPVATHA